MTLEELFGGRVNLDESHERLAALMAAEGLPYSRRTHTYQSRRAQELAKWAEGLPGGAGIHDALYRAYFVDGLNLAETDVLVAVAEGLGLPGEEARAAIEERRFREAVDRDWIRSREIGVTAVPTFVAGNRGVIGAHPYPVLERLVREAGAEPRGEGQPGG